MPSALIGAGMHADGVVMNALPPTMPKNVSVMCVIVMFWLSGPRPTVRGRSLRKLSMPKSLLTPCPVRRYAADSVFVELATPARLVTWMPRRAGSPFCGAML